MHSCYLYQHGKGLLNYLRAPEQRDDDAAQNNFDNCYELGIGVEKDYQHGIGVEKIFQNAVELYQKAAEKAHTAAQYNLGHCYQHGIGVKKDVQKAVELYLKAAEQKDDAAQYNLGYCYQHGIGDV